MGLIIGGSMFGVIEQKRPSVRKIKVRGRPVMIWGAEEISEFIFSWEPLLTQKIGGHQGSSNLREWPSR